MKVIAIDLGTTMSVVTIAESRTGKGFLSIGRCPGCTVLVDRFSRPYTPSVVAEDQSGKEVVGFAAKARAGFEPAPIMFAKRFMGTDKTFQLDKLGVLRPEEVSAHVLRHLKDLAEEVLGEKVEEAVITVPAYFTLRAKQMTEKAAELAGLKVRQIALEPVAAALMYCAGDPRDPLTIMTYDLGGGTFDVAILEKKDKVITSKSIRAFDGDRFLGGYNFDKTLAFWIMDQLNTKGYDLNLNPDDPADGVPFARLMVIAEQTKIALSKRETVTIQEPSTGIVDRSGNPVSIELEISRGQFEDMIRREIEYTIQICRRAMTEKPSKPMKPEDIDEIVMVGGSSRIPLVSRLVEEAFGKAPKLVEPDLCVALGAAIIAAGAGQSHGNLELSPIPSETDLPSLTISGSIVEGGGLDDVAGCVVTLSSADGSYHKSRTTGPNGAFVFESVPLAAEETTDFEVSAKSARGAEVGSHKFSIRRTHEYLPGDGAGSGGVTVTRVMNVLSKPVYIMLVDGPYEIAPAGQTLPFTTTIPAKRADTTVEIRIAVLEENLQWGELVMSGIPESLPVGSSVEVTLTIEKNFRVLVRAYLPALARKQEAEIKVPVPREKSLEELRSDYEVLRERADEAIRAAGPAAGFRDASAKRLTELLAQVGQMLAERSPDCPRIQERLGEVETLIKRVGAGWKAEPPRNVFEDKAAEAKRLIDRLYREQPETKKDGYDLQLGDIRKEAESAYKAQDGAGWKGCFNRVVKLADDVHGLLEPQGGGPEDPAALLIALAKDLDTLRKMASDKGRLAELSSQFDAAAKALRQIDPKTPDAMDNIRDWYFHKFQPLYELVLDEKPRPDGRLKRA